MWNILIECYVRHSFLRPSLRHEKMACTRRSFNENKRKSRLAKDDWRAGRNFYKLMQINKTTLKLESEPKQKEKNTKTNHKGIVWFRMKRVDTAFNFCKNFYKPWPVTLSNVLIKEKCNLIYTAISVTRIFENLAFFSSIPRPLKTKSSIKSNLVV